MEKQWKHCQTLLFLGSKIIADGDCSHEIKRRLLLGRKVITNLDSILKSRDIANKGLGFPGAAEVKASAYNAGDLGSIPGSRRSLGEGNGNPLQYSCLAWREEPGGLQSMGSQRVGHD